MVCTTLVNHAWRTLSLDSKRWKWWFLDYLPQSVQNELKVVGGGEVAYEEVIRKYYVHSDFKLLYTFGLIAFIEKKGTEDVSDESCICNSTVISKTNAKATNITLLSKGGGRTYQKPARVVVEVEVNLIDDVGEGDYSNTTNTCR